MKKCLVYALRRECDQDVVYRNLLHIHSSSPEPKLNYTVLPLDQESSTLEIGSKVSPHRKMNCFRSNVDSLNITRRNQFLCCKRKTNEYQKKRKIVFGNRRRYTKTETEEKKGKGKMSNKYYGPGDLHCHRRGIQKMFRDKKTGKLCALSIEPEEHYPRKTKTMSSHHRKKPYFRPIPFFLPLPPMWISKSSTAESSLLITSRTVESQKKIIIIRSSSS